MRKEKSWTRLQYEMTYRNMRFFRFSEFGTYFIDMPQEIVKAADYSYQAKGYEVHGWSKDERRKRFSAIFWRVVTARGELPF